MSALSSIMDAPETRAAHCRDTLWRRFDEQATLTPERCAVQIGRQQLTYGQLRDRSLRVGCEILDRIGKGNQPVVVLIDKSLDQIVAMLGVQAAGKIAVPIDGERAPDRVRAIIAETEPQLVIIRSNDGPVRDWGFPAADLASLESAQTGATDHASHDPDDLATILYTSGSTARPKGATRSHANWLHAVLRFSCALRVQDGDRLYRPGSFTFAGGQRALYCALINGMTMVSDRHVDDLKDFAQCLRDERINILHTPVHMLRRLVDSANGVELADLREVFVAGDGLPSELARRFLSRFPDRPRLIHALSLTETSTVRQAVVNCDTAFDEEFVGVGLPVEDMDVLIVDDALRPLPAGSVGQVGVRSRYLMQGYWRRPDLNDAAFFDDPDGGPNRVYLTGDLGVIDATGELRLRGRRDHRVKIRGYTIDPAEVTAALLRLDGVADAVVLGQVDDNGDDVLAAHVVPSPGRTITVAQIRRGLSPMIPAYMIPRYVAFLDNLPRSGHGKVDRTRLTPITFQDRPALDQPYVPPSDDAEILIAAIWRDLLRVGELGVHDDFFELGGHSMLAIELATALEKTFGTTVPLADLFESPTVAKMARRLKAAGGASRAVRAVALQPAGPGTPLFCLAGLHAYRELARALGADHPVYGVYAADEATTGDTAEPATQATIQRRAARYVEVIRQQQPTGPYRLAGHSAGGIYAVEAARQLQQQGQTVAFLGLIDTCYAGSRRFGRTHWFVDHLRQARRIPQRLALRWDRLRQPADNDEPDTPLTRRRRLYKISGVYQPSAVDCGAVVFVAEEQRLHIGYRWLPDLGWSRWFAGGCRVETTPGSHMAMLRGDNAVKLAERMRPYLRPESA